MKKLMSSIYTFMIKISLVAFLGGGSMAVAGQVSDGQVKRIYPSSNGNVYFRLKGDSCITGSQYYYFELSHESADAWYSMLLTSATTEKPVRVSVNECPAEGHVKASYIFQDY